MEKSKKKRIANVVMVLLILLIIAAAIVLVGKLTGRFGGAESAAATAEKLYGVVSVERSGASFELKEGDGLQSGDVLTTSEKAGVKISAGKNSFELAENGSAKLAFADGQTSLDLSKGELFVVLGEGKSFGGITAGGQRISAEGTVFSVSALKGSMSVSVFEGNVLVSGGGKENRAEAGQLFSYVEQGDCREVRELKADSLNDFNIERALEALAERKLCFEEKELRQVLADREAEAGEALSEAEEENGADGGSDESGKTPAGSTGSGKTPANSAGNSSGAGNSTGSGASSSAGGSAAQSPASGSGGSSGSGSGSGQNGSSGSTSSGSGGGASSGSGSGNSGADSEKSYSCVIEIRCDTILDNWDDLDKSKAGYVPKSGVILARTKVSFTKGESVLDVLSRVCKQRGIQLEYSYTPAYGSSYVEGINHLYEFDCGPLSGWMYKVNGWFPNYGCSEYKLSDGDSISWLYTCKGLGEDVGGSVYG